MDVRVGNFGKGGADSLSRPVFIDGIQIIFNDNYYIIIS